MHISKRATPAAVTLFALLAVLISFVSPTAMAKPAISQCSALFEHADAKSIRLQPNRLQIVVADPYEQWLRWQELANREDMIKITTPVEFETVYVPRSEVEIWSVNGSVPHQIEQMFVSADHVIWPKHKFNTDPDVPFFERESDGPPLSVRLLASRSTAPVSNTSISIKLGTNHPHGTDRPPQPTKARTNIDILTAISRGEHIRQADQRLRPDSVFVAIFDVFAMIDKRTRNGVLIRDLSRFQDGNYHFPALSIPYAGRAIAAANGMGFVEFWREHYAAALGRAKARMLLRYGLQMVTPNPQNFSIPLDVNLKPTGQIEFADISDSCFVAPVATALGFKAAQMRDFKAELGIDNDIFPFWENSRFLFDDAGPFSIRREILNDWGHAHDMAYISEIERALGVVVVKNKNPRSAVFHYFFGSMRLSKLQRFLESREGQRRIAEYAAANRRLP